MSPPPPHNSRGGRRALIGATLLSLAPAFVTAQSPTTASTAPPPPSATQPDQPDLAKLLESIKQLQDSIPGLSGDEREQAIDRAIQLRASVLPKLTALDAKSISLRYDQAAALLARLARDGSDTSLLVGLADPDRKKQAADAVESAARLLSDLPRERAPLRELLLRGRLELLRSRLETSSAARAQAVKRAISAFHDAERMTESIAEAEAFRKSGLALALFFEGSREAIKLAQTMLKDLVTTEQPTALEIQATRLFLAANPSQLDAAIADFDALEAKEPLERVVRVEIGVRAMLNVWETTQSPTLLASALTRLASIATRDDLAIPADGRSQIAERLMATVHTLTQVTAPSDDWPALALLALASRTEDPAKARALFDAVSKRDDADDLAGEAMWRAANAGPKGGEDAERLPRLMAFIKQHPEHPQAPAAAALAIDLTLPRDAKGAVASIPPEAREALELGVSRFPDAAPAGEWRLLLARAHAERSDWKSAIAQLDRVPKASPAFDRSSEAIFAIAATRLDELARAHTQAQTQHQVQPQSTASPAASPTTIAKEMLALARRSRDALSTRWPVDDARMVRLRIAVAEGTLDAADPAPAPGSAAANSSAGTADARDLFRTLIPLASKVPGGLARVQLGLARAKLTTKDREEGFKNLKSLAAELDARNERSPIFWHAWTLIIETIAMDKGHSPAPTPLTPAPSETGQPPPPTPPPAPIAPDYAGAARANVEKLRTIDATLGGEPWRTRIERALESMAR